MTGCRLVGCNDCKPLSVQYRYVNETSQNVVFEVLNGGGDAVAPSGSIPKNDSVSLVFKIGFEGNPFPWDDSTVFKIRFESTPPRCLIYEGALQDTLKDPRSQRAYARANGRDIYRLTTSHFDSAALCP